MDHIQNFVWQYVESRVLQNTFGINNSYDAVKRDCYSVFAQHDVAKIPFCLFRGVLDPSVPNRLPQGSKPPFAVSGISYLIRLFNALSGNLPVSAPPNIAVFINTFNERVR